MKKSVIIYVIGVFLPLVLLCRSAVAETAADLSQAEGLYKAGRYAQAEQPYLRVLRTADSNKPAEADAAVTAAKGLALVYVATDRLPQAKEAIQPLLKRPTPHALHEIVDGAKAINKVARVRQVYQEMIAAKPNDPQVIWLKTGLGIASVQLADDQAVQATLQDIVTKHGSDDRVVEAYGQIAWAYRKLNQYDKALKINQYTVDNWPQKPRAAYAQQGILVCQLALKNLEAADQAFDTLVQKFGQDPEASKIALWSGFAYQDANQPERAYKVYGVVVQNYPETPEAVVAQLRRAEASVQAEDPNRMQQDIQALMKLRPSQDQASGLRYLADSLFWKHEAYANASVRQDLLALVDGYRLAIANYTVTTWPESEWAMSAERDLASLAIERGNEGVASTLFNTMLTRYAKQDSFPRAICRIGDSYLTAGKYDQADQLYQYVGEHWPTSQHVIWAKLGTLKVNIARDAERTADAMYDKMLADFVGHPDLRQVVFAIGEAYQVRAGAEFRRLMAENGRDYAIQFAKSGDPESVRVHLRKAVEKWDTIIDGTLPGGSELMPEALYFGASTYVRLGDHPRALNYCTKILQQWPNYEHAWLACLMLAREYSRQMANGTLAREEGKAAIGSIHRLLLEKYPMCPAASAIRSAMQRPAGRDLSGPSMPSIRGGEK